MKTAWKILSGNKTVRKATTALGTTLVGGFGIALSDGNLDGAEALVALGAALVAAAGVWKVGNAGEARVVEVEVR